MPQLIKYLEDKKFIAGNEVTYVDFYFFERLQQMIFVTNGKIFEEYPILKTYNETMMNLPKLKEYLEDMNCPEVGLNFNNKHAKINGKMGFKYWNQINWTN